MDPRVLASVLWGAIAGLSFLVLVQSYELITAVRIGFGLKFLIAGIVACCTVAITYILDKRLLRWFEDR